MDYIVFSYVLGTQVNGHRHKHLIGISLLSWASLQGVLYGISLSVSLFLLTLRDDMTLKSRYLILIYYEPLFGGYKSLIPL